MAGKRRFHFLRAASDELDAAIEYFEREQEGLGDEFALEVENTIERILDNPLAWQIVEEGARRCRTHRFDYGLVYRLLSEDEVEIVAVMHLKRQPGYWRGRI